MAKILLIDDSWLMRRGLSSMICSASHSVIEAENGKDGLALLASERPDCIVLDLLMPEMDGYQVLEHLKKKDNTIPVVICSADIQKTAREKCMALGATGFLNKPPQEKEILSAINEAIGD